MKNNVTLDLQIVCATRDLQPTEDTYIVILRETRKGRQIHQVLTPGKKFRKFFLDSTEKYSAYSVSRFQNFRHAFSLKCQTRNYVHAFSLDINFTFQVEDPGILLDNLDLDPIRTIANDLAYRLSDLALWRLSWNEIENGAEIFRDILGTTVETSHGDRSSVEDHLKTLGSRFGIKIHRIDVEHTIQDRESLLYRHEIPKKPKANISLQHARVKSEMGSARFRWPVGIDHRPQLATRPKLPVHVSTVAPRSIRPGARFLCEVVFHVDDYQITDDQAKSIDRRAATIGLREGARLKVILLPLEDGTFNIDETEGQCEWGPPSRRVQFSLQATKSGTEGMHQIRVEVWCKEIQLTRLYLQLEVASKTSSDQLVSVQTTRKLPSSAFASYSSSDRLRVAERVASLDAAGIDVFIDCLDLKPADNWREILEREILNRDALFLFWSLAASRSAWVDKEWRYSLEHRGDEHIIPNALEPPEKCPPPVELQHLHFGSPLMPLIEIRQLDETREPTQ